MICPLKKEINRNSCTTFGLYLNVSKTPLLERLDQISLKMGIIKKKQDVKFSQALVLDKSYLEPSFIIESQRWRIASRKDTCKQELYEVKDVSKNIYTRSRPSYVERTNAKTLRKDKH